MPRAAAARAPLKRLTSRRPDDLAHLTNNFNTDGSGTPGMERSASTASLGTADGQSSKGAHAGTCSVLLRRGPSHLTWVEAHPTMPFYLSTSGGLGVIQLWQFASPTRCTRTTRRFGGAPAAHRVQPFEQVRGERHERTLHLQRRCCAARRPSSTSCH